MKWFLVLSQDGGCDYTIGCGYAHWIVEADTEEEARRKARDAVEREGYLDTGLYATTLSGIEMYPLKGDPVDLPVAQWREQKAEREQRAAEEESEAERRRQYEQLKQEFGDG